MEPNFPCGVDCSAIATPQCLAAVCDEATLQCKVVPTPGGESCDDNLFCTVGETCQGGLCQGGAENTCDQEPQACKVIVCNENGKSCSQQPIANGTLCEPSDLCQVNAACVDGACVGVAKDCFFFPVPDSCKVGQCNPETGECVAVPGNEGKACSDSGDLCMVNKTCQNGLCDGGAPKNCSSLSVGCQNGVCDPGTGSCYPVPLKPGDQCLQGTNECNLGTCDQNNTCVANPTPGVQCASQTFGCTVGLCSDAGQCMPTPAAEGAACQDGNMCTLGESCAAGICQGGQVVTPTVYFADTFADNSAGWTLGTDWQIGPAAASSGQSYGNPDPATDHTPTGDNGVAGVAIGGNVPKVIHGQYYLTSPVFDASAPGPVYLDFWRHLNSDYATATTIYMKNQIEVYNGTSWVVLWASGSSPGINDAQWTRISHDITAYKSATMQVRFGFEVGSTAAYTASGWNIDDVTISNAVCP